MTRSLATLGVVIVSASLAQASEGDRILGQLGSRLVGRWACTVTAEGRTARFTTTCEWGVGRKSLVMEARVAGAPKAEHTTLIGWNPKENELVALGFRSDGGATIGRIMRLGRDGKTWLLEAAGATSGGTEGTATAAYTFFGTKTFKMDISNVKIGCKRKGDPPTLYFRRR